MELHLNYVQAWTPDGPDGRCHVLGTCAPDELPGAIRQGWHDAVRGGWGPGTVIVTDANGNLIEIP